MLPQSEANVLREHVGDVVAGGAVHQFGMAVSDDVAVPVVTHAQMFGALLGHVVVGEGNGTLVVAVDGGGVLWVADFGQQLP